MGADYETVFDITREYFKYTNLMAGFQECRQFILWLRLVVFTKLFEKYQARAAGKHVGNPLLYMATFFQETLDEVVANEVAHHLAAYENGRRVKSEIPY